MVGGRVVGAAKFDGQSWDFCFHCELWNFIQLLILQFSSSLKSEFKINTHKGTKDCSANALLLLMAVTVLTHAWLSGGNESQRVGGEAGPQRAAAFT